MPAILFVCTANQCRSPMASALFREILAKRGIGADWRVESAGTWAVEGAPASEGSLAVMAARGIDLSGHRARGVTGELLASFDLVLTMERNHKEALKAEFAEAVGRIYMLSEMAELSHDVRDPIGGAFADYLETATEIERLLQRGFENIQRLAGA